MSSAADVEWEDWSPYEEDEGRSNAVKEMESWAMSGRDGTDISRSSGLLSDNVTEERMLNSRLKELAKERHKFINQTDYERKIFLDRQTRKSSVFKDLIHEIAPEGKLSKTGVRSTSGNNARMRMLERLNPLNKKKEGMGDKITSMDSMASKMASTESLSNRQLMSKTASTESLVKIPTKAESVGGGVGGRSTSCPPVRNNKTFPTESRLNRNNRLTVETIAENQAAATLPQLQTTNTAAPQFGKHPPILRKTSSMTLLNSKEKPAARSKKLKVTITEPSPVKDGRYQKLERSLSETFGPMDGYTVDLPLIISNVEALHVKPLHGKSKTKTEIALKVQAFMAEQGIVF